MTRPKGSRQFGNNLRSLLRWRRGADDVREEIELHVDLRSAELIAAGRSRDDARAQAIREAGDVSRVAPIVDRYAGERDRSTLRVQHFDELRQDTTYALRSFRRAPGFTALAVLTVALGLGANAAIFGVVNVAFFTPLPFDPDNTLVRVREYRTAPDGSRLNVDASRRTADAIASRPDLFRSSVAIAGGGRALARREGALRVATARVGPGFTSVVGVAPVIGRTFTAAEELSGEGSGVVLISHGFWQRALGGLPTTVGGTISLDGRPFVVVGVLPPSFHVPYETDAWVPSRFGENERSIFLLARLNPGVTLERAQTELEPLGRELSRQYPEVLRGLGVTAVSARDYFVADNDRVALALMGAVAFLLLIACSNVALLLTTKFAARRTEVAVRAALGCGRGRQLRQFMTEGVLLFIAGGFLGVVLALWMRESLVVFLPEALAHQVGIQGIPIDARLIGFAALLSLVAGIGFGAIAALRAARADVHEVMKGGGRSVAGSSSRGTLGWLVVVEVALALILMTAAGVMLDSFRRLEGRDLGVRPDGIVTMQVDLSSPRYAAGDARRGFLSGVLDRIRALPQVQSAGATTVNPFCCGNWGMRVTPEGHVAAAAEETPIVQHFIVTPGYFETLSQPLVEGRTFTRTDTAGAEMAVVVDSAFAKRFWPGQSAIGKRVKRGTLDQQYPWLTVVGVVAPALEEGAYPESWYLPHAQHPDGPSATGAHLLIRGHGDTASILSSVRTIAAEMDPNLPLYRVAMLSDLIAENIKQDRLGALVTTLFAGAGLLLAALGLYAVLSFVVGQDTKEIGVRRALGAPRAAILRLVLGRALRLTGTGLALGILGSVAIARLLTSLVEGSRVDGMIIAAASVLLLSTSLLAALLPAWRALRFDPLQALRAE